LVGPPGAKGSVPTARDRRDLVTGTEEWSDEMFRLLALERASFALTDQIIFSLVHEENRGRGPGDSRSICR